MGLLSDALRYPTNRQDGWTNPIAVGGILHFLSNFLLPYPLVLGYYLRVLDSTIAGEPEPPRFDGGWGRLYLDGLKVFVVAAIPLIVPWLFAGALLASMGGPFGTGPGPGAVGGALLIAAIISAVLWYVVPASLANLEYEGRFSAAVSVTDVVGAITKQEYFVSWVLGTALYLGLVIVFSILAFIPLLGLLIIVFVGPAMLFFVSTSAFYLYGRGFSHARGITPEMTSSEPGPEGLVTERSEQNTRSD